jgi:predicted transcriptional regulator
VRTTVDIDPRLLARAKQLAAEQRRTLGAVVGDALSAYLASRSAAVADPPFKLLVRGRPNGRFPTPAEVAAIEEEEDIAALAIPRKARRAAP